MAPAEKLTPKRKARLEKLKAILTDGSKPPSVGGAAELLHASRDVLVDDVRILKLQGELPASFKFLSGKLAKAIATRQARRRILLGAYGKGLSLSQIAESLRVSSQLVRHDLNWWRDEKDPGLARAEKTRETQTRLTAEEVRHRRVEEHREEIANLEASIGMTVEDLSFLNLISQYEGELVGFIRGGRLDPLDKKTLSRFRVLEVTKNLGPARLGLTDRAKAVLWDLGAPNPYPIKFHPSLGWTSGVKEPRGPDQPSSEATQANAED